MKTVILFDADAQHYRQSIYKYFYREFKKYGYNLIIVYDRKLNFIDHEMFVGIDYNFQKFNEIIKKYNCKLVILFVWLRYMFLIPFMMFNRLKGD